MGYQSLIGLVPHFLAFYFISSLSHSFHPLTVFGQLSCCATSSLKSAASSSSDNSRMACVLLFMQNETKCDIKYCWIIHCFCKSPHFIIIIYNILISIRVQVYCKYYSSLSSPASSVPSKTAI